MSKFLSLFIAIRYGKSHNNFIRFIGWLSVAGITLGVMALIIICSVMNGLQQSMVNSLLNTVPQAQLTTQQGYFNPNQYPIKEFIPALDNNNIQAITPLVTSQVIIQNEHELDLVTLLGVTPHSFDPIAATLPHQILMSLKTGQYKVIIGGALARKMNLKIGDKIRLIVPNATLLTPFGRIPSQRLFTISGIFSVNSYVDSNFILLNQHDASKLLQYPTGDISSWRLYLKHPLKINSTIIKTLPDGFISKDWRISQGDLFSAVKMEKHTMTLLISLIIIVATFNVIASLSLLVMDKEGEIAILQTLGLTKIKILGIFILRGIWAGGIGTLLGTALGLLVTYHINELLALLHLSVLGVLLPVDIHTYQILQIILFSLAISLLATLYPAWYAAHQKPAEILRYE